MLNTSRRDPSDQASLGRLVETGLLAIESLHPGGLELTRELAGLCGIENAATVLDVASGTGASACFLAEQFGVQVTGIDYSEAMLRRALAKLRASQLQNVCFQRADAARLPFREAVFDVVLCECTLCFFDKESVIGEMMRVLKPGGRVGMHDLYWQVGAPEGIRRTLSEIEGEHPESLAGWSQLFRRSGFVDVTAVDKSDLLQAWMKESKRRLGPIGWAALLVRIVHRWGVRGLWRILRSERVFSSRHLGYGIVVATRP